MMRPRTKSTRDTAASDLKGRKPSEGKLHEGKHRKKEDLGETRRNLVRALTLLGHKPDKKALLSQLSQLIHDEIRARVANQNSQALVERVAVNGSCQLQKVNGSCQLQKVNGSCQLQKGNGSCQLQKGRRRSNSTLDEYFKDKFGSPPKDEEEVEKKLRVLRALKNSQELVAKNSMRGFQNSWVHSVCDLHDNNIVLEKMRSRMTK